MLTLGFMSFTLTIQSRSEPRPAGAALFLGFLPNHSKRLSDRLYKDFSSGNVRRLLEKLLCLGDRTLSGDPNRLHLSNLFID